MAIARRPPLKTIGLVGGMSWESSLHYYRIINERVKEQLGGFHSARSLMYSFDFDEVEYHQARDEWTEAGHLLIEAAMRLQRSGCDLLVLCSNTMHRLANDIAAAVDLPLLHIVDAVAETMRGLGVERAGLLGTRYTMQGAFYRDRLASHGFTIDVPTPEESEAVHRIIFDELVHGSIRPGSRSVYLDVIRSLVDRGDEAVILGCTEIEVLVRDGDATVPLLETARIHAEAAASVAMGLTGLPSPPDG